MDCQTVSCYGTVQALQLVIVKYKGLKRSQETHGVVHIIKHVVDMFLYLPFAIGIPTPNTLRLEGDEPNVKACSDVPQCTILTCSKTNRCSTNGMIALDCSVRMVII